ncbi:DNA recombination protein RmuC [Mucisphaera sp.]|uniref:DNA recombination protein RmuC n=1 Tax=Mucisphaera sp. TaxID=2913024 RepID=UPI003D14E89F
MPLMNTFLIAAASAAGLLALILAATTLLLWRDRTRTQAAHQQQLEDHEAQLTAERNRTASLETALNEAKVDRARLETEIASFQQRLTDQKKALDEARLEAQNAFKALASDALKQNTDQFLKLAADKLKAEQKAGALDLDQRKQAVEQLVTPVREALDKQAKAVTEMEKQREAAYHALRQQLTSLNETQQTLKDETGNLVKALRRPEVRGRWGEIQLRRVAELAGMIDHCDFAEQPSFENPEAGKQRPDMAVALPGGRRIVIDAKTPLDAYLDAMQAPDENTQQSQLDRHASQIMAQVNNLASKAYQQNFDRTPDFVVLFIPSEAFLEPALRRKPTLIEDAMAKGIVIATPGTLMALLKAVAIGWREERVAESAREIAEHGRELHKRVATAIEHLTKLGKSIDATITTYNKLVGSIDRQVLPQARRFENLGANSEKSLPADGQIKLIEQTVRTTDHA